jgi:hypothetical protein
MADSIKGSFLNLLSGLVLGLFALVWIWIGIKMLTFSASSTTETLSFSQAQVTVAGFLASAVGAGTASVLGIEIQKATVAADVHAKDKTLALRVSAAAQQSVLLVAGISVYALIGSFVLIVWFFKSDISPEMVSAFSLGVLGWLAGAFAAVFRTTPST